jgi:hexosaminidase
MNLFLRTLVVALTVSMFGTAAPGSAEIVGSLRAMGYSLVPAAKKIQLNGREVVIDSSWGIDAQVPHTDIAVRRLKDGAAELLNLRLTGSGQGRIVLRVAVGKVAEAPQATAREAYALSIAPGRIEITGNAGPGLFYGVQSLLQIARPAGIGCRVPEAEIADWPALQLRFIHWDTKHHQDRPETLKRLIDWAAFFKANAIGFEIEDKYEFPRHPVVGAPGAFTKAQLQELTRYALERNIQLVPQIQAPAHMAYVLKHDEFKHLRADGSNYQASMCDEEAIAIIQDLYQDMIDATPGVEYFHVSTDEVYFAGISAKCQANRPYNEKNRSLTWVEFAARMHKWLSDRGRKMLCWVEYPVLEEHLSLLPKGLISGVATPGRSAWNDGLKKAGVPSLIYHPLQGSELLFPNYFSTEFLDEDRPVPGRLAEPGALISRVLRENPNELIGTFSAAWDDSGLHSETFWPGWVMTTQYGWSPDGPRPEQVLADFVDVYYGAGNQDIVEVYRTLEDGARYYESSLDRVPATRLKPTYGSYAGPGRDTTRIDLRIEPPQIPFAYDESIIVERNFSRKYARVLAQLPEMRIRLDQAVAALQGKLGTVARNRYNVEVLLSIAQFERHFIAMMGALKDAEDLMLQAADAQRQERPRDVVALLNRANGLVKDCLADRKSMWDGLTATWEKSRYPKGQSVGGRNFVHILDDLKDHRADRRPGLDYMLEPLELTGLESWSASLARFIQTYSTPRQLGTDLGK